MGRSTMPGDRHKRAAVLVARWMVLVMPFAGGPATAQNSSYISNNTSVIVDTEVLESLGGQPPAVDGIIGSSPRQAVNVQRSAPRPSPTVARLPAPATAPRSRLNPEALARLGFRQIPPAQPKQHAVAKPVAPAPKPATASVARPTPAVAPKPVAARAVAPKPVAAQAAASPPSQARQTRNVPARPVLPTVKAPEPTPAAARQTTKQAKVAPPPPPAPPSPTTIPKAAAKPVVAAALAPPKQAAPRVAAVGGDDGGLRLLFDNGSAKLSDSARSNLQSLTTKLDADEALQVQLVAYAEGTAQTSSQARRLSLSRALAVRSFLIDKGVRSTRMDIRALGNKAEDGPADRVDVVLVQK